MIVFDKATKNWVASMGICVPSECTNKDDWSPVFDFLSTKLSSLLPPGMDAGMDVWFP